jgi:hypothetical protein
MFILIIIKLIIIKLIMSLPNVFEELVSARAPVCTFACVFVRFCAFLCFLEPKTRANSISRQQLLRPERLPTSSSSNARGSSLRRRKLC